jgi:hypothetical protein
MLFQLLRLHTTERGDNIITNDEYVNDCAVTTYFKVPCKNAPGETEEKCT